MGNVTLIIGGPGSGKTDQVIERLATLYEANSFADALALTPTVRHGDQFRRRLVSRCRVALGLRVETISRFSRGLEPGTSTPSHALADELLTRTVHSQVQSGGAAYFRPIAGTRGLSSLVQNAVNDLLAEGVAPKAVSEAANRTGADSLIALGAIYVAYMAELGQRGWAHPAQSSLAAAGAVRAGAAVPKAIVVDGFHLFRGTEPRAAASSWGAQGCGSHVGP